MLLNENQLYIQSQCMFLNESLIVTKEDIWWNRQAWKKNEINICFILGFSGSGKSTLSKAMSKGHNNMAYAELDVLVENKRYDDEKLKEKSPYIYEYLNGPGKKYRNVDIHLVKNKQMVRDCVTWLVRKQKSINKKFIIEGIHLLLAFEPSEFEKYAVCIKGTSYATSAYRGAKRELAKKEKTNKLSGMSVTAAMPLYNHALNKYIRFYANKNKQDENK